MKKLIAIAAVVLLVTGCASQSEPEYPSSYRSVEELKEAFVKAGGECPDWEQTNQVKLAAESGTCSESNVLSIYSSEAVRDEALAAYKSIALGDSTLLVGENWIINDKRVKELDSAIGGTFVTT